MRAILGLTDSVNNEVLSLAALMDTHTRSLTAIQPQKHNEGRGAALNTQRDDLQSVWSKILFVAFKIIYL